MPLTPPVVSSRASRVLVTNVTVIDPATGAKSPGQDVLIAAGRIVAVRQTGGPTLPDAEVVDGAGRHVVPGYNDMHAHPFNYKDPSRTLELMLAHGITGVRQMSGSSSMLANRGTLGTGLSPRLLALPGAVLTPVNAAIDEAAVDTVRQQHEQGADFIKAALVRRDVFFAAQAEANRLGIPILGHLPRGIDVRRASSEGIGSVEHLGPGVGLLSCCTADPAGLQEQAALKPEPALPSFLANPILEPVLEAMVRKMVVHTLLRADQSDIDLYDTVNNHFDEQAATALASALAADRTWQVPTLIRSRAQMFCEDASHNADPDLRYIGSSTQKTWRKATAKYAKFSADWRATFRTTYATMLTLTRFLDDAGVPMLAGSDACGAAWVIPGSSLHREFDELGAAGLTPLTVLQMTTSNAAEFLGATSTMGSVSEGRDADLVLLDADPLDASDNLHAVAAVVRAGRVIGGAELDAMKTDVAADPVVS